MAYAFLGVCQVFLGLHEQLFQLVSAVFRLKVLRLRRVYSKTPRDKHWYIPGASIISLKHVLNSNTAKPKMIRRHFM